MANSMNVSPVKSKQSMMKSANASFVGSGVVPGQASKKQSTHSVSGTSKHPILANKQQKLH